MDIQVFVNLTSRAWALPILSSLQAGTAGRQATLLTATGASRTAFSQSIDHLIKMGLVERNPGYGHPIRPEFRLTQLGKSAAKIARRIQRVSGAADQDLLRRTWTLPILTSLHEPRHFNDIKRNLPTITDRALSLSLRSMEDREWVQRCVNEAARPPRSIYTAINTGEKVSKVILPEITVGQG
ncbi:winged helix-turn-helix transcriptional regulator [uncultured Roseobacter sp.]|uniref:winged helix-turn-helix transcriptional regulator n=1 Tax=uncultured Roseobacter sp. TaxID=114847 RepID=UPI00262F7F41|nr:winged helix-turn-helix transcriptional regulator [uncultured Roseobacter sp.]